MSEIQEMKILTIENEEFCDFFRQNFIIEENISCLDPKGSSISSLVVEAVVNKRYPKTGKSPSVAPEQIR